MRYFWNVLIALDQLGNALRGGDPDETISSAIAKEIRFGSAKAYEVALGRFLEFVDPGHLEGSIEWDEGRKLNKLPAQLFCARCAHYNDQSNLKGAEHGN